MGMKMSEKFIPQRGRYEVDGYGHLSGSGNDMTGTLDFTSCGGATVTFASSSLGLPTGSFRVTLPAANPYKAQAEGRFGRTVRFEADLMLPASAVTTGSALNSNLDLRVIALTHNTFSGTYDFCVVASTGSATNGGRDRVVPAIPTGQLRFSWKVDGANDSNIR